MDLTRRQFAIGAPAGIAGVQVMPDGRGAADALVAATGGAANWRAARGLRIRAIHYEAAMPRPYANVIHMALDEPLMRFEGRSADIDRVRAVSARGGWRVSEVSPLQAMTAEQVRSDLDWWEAHVYRNIWRLANRDPAIEPRLGADGRLELYRRDGRLLMWYRLNAAGEPVAFAPSGAEQGTVLGPMTPRRGGLRSPAWVTSADGAFRAEITEWAALRARPAVRFDRP